MNFQLGVGYKTIPSSNLIKLWKNPSFPTRKCINNMWVSKLQKIKLPEAFPKNGVHHPAPSPSPAVPNVATVAALLLGNPASVWTNVTGCFLYILRPAMQYQTIIIQSSLNCLGMGMIRNKTPITPGWKPIDKRRCKHGSSETKSTPSCFFLSERPLKMSKRADPQGPF